MNNSLMMTKTLPIPAASPRGCDAARRRARKPGTSGSAAASCFLILLVQREAYPTSTAAACQKFGLGGRRRFFPELNDEPARPTGAAAAWLPVTVSPT